MKDETEQEKQQKIVDAVNALQGELTHDNCYFEYGDTYLYVEASGIASYCTARVKTIGLFFSFVCTVEEFNQCVKEMSAHGTPGAFADYVISRAAGVNTQLQPRYSGWDPSQGHANCRCTDKKQIEWKNGDKCIWNTKKCVFVGVSCVSSELAIIEVGDGAVLEKVVTDRVRISELEKPPSKEKRWIAYNSKINRAMSRGHKTKSDCYNAMASNRFRDEYQYIEIEINV